MAAFIVSRCPRGSTVHQIGTDQGLLPAPIAVTHVQLAPAERADLVIDFAPHRGTRDSC